LLNRLDNACEKFDVNAVIELIRLAPTEFNYTCACSDLVVNAACDVRAVQPVVSVIAPEKSLKSEPQLALNTSKQIA
jgi:hypothetical protein